LNALNRTNVGLAPGTIDPSAGAATGFTRTLMRRRVAAGLAIDY
jgi:hypothetical protein